MQSSLAAVTGNAERKTEGGRDYIVVPVSMIVPGVLTGSKGSLYYPQERVARNASEWNGIPVTLGHPSHPVTNAPQSALRDEGVVDRVGLGVLRNSRFQNGKLRADAWLDVEKTRRIAPEVHDAALNGRRVEVSTGLFTKEIERPGTFNGRAYTHEVVDYGPDHFAILTDQRGACSVQDGCGMNVHNAFCPGEGANDNSCSSSGGGGAGHETVQQQVERENREKDEKERKKVADRAAKAGHTGPYHPLLAFLYPEEETTNESTCPCGGTCRECVRNAAAMPKTSSKPAKTTPAVAAKSADALAIKTEYAGSVTPTQAPVEHSSGMHPASPPNTSTPAPRAPAQAPGEGPGTAPASQGTSPSRMHPAQPPNTAPAAPAAPAQAPTASAPASEPTDNDDEDDEDEDDTTDNEGCTCGGKCDECKTHNTFAEDVDYAVNVDRSFSEDEDFATVNWCNQHGGDSCKVGGGAKESQQSSTFHLSKTLAKEASKAAAKKGSNSLTKDAHAATTKALGAHKFADAHHEAAAKAHDEAATFSSGDLKALHHEAAHYHREAASGGQTPGREHLAHSYVAKAATDKANEQSKMAKTKDDHNLAKSLHYEASDHHDRAAAVHREAGRIKLAERHEKLSEQHAQVARGHKFQMTKNSQVGDVVLNAFLASCSTINEGDGYGDPAVDAQPRCPIKQTFQPKGYKGKGNGSVHIAAKAGAADTAGSFVKDEETEVTDNSTHDRGVLGLTTTEGVHMKRQEMIQHLTTNCDCYKGKAGGVLNHMTNEQLVDLIQNHSVVDLAKSLLGDSTLATNAMPAALQKALDKKGGKAKGDEEDTEDEEPDGDEMPTGNNRPQTVDEWLKTTNAPKAVRQLVQNAATAERNAKEQLIEVLTANVSDPSANAALRRTYLSLPIKVLKAQVDAMPTANAAEDFGFDVDDNGPSFAGAAFLGGDNGIVGNRFGGGNGEAIIEEPAYSIKN